MRLNSHRTRRLGVLALALPALLSALVAAPSLAAPGDVDTSYGGGDGNAVPTGGNVRITQHAGLANGQALIAYNLGVTGIKLKRISTTGGEVWEAPSVMPEGFSGYLSLAYDATRGTTYLAGSPDEGYTTRVWRFTSAGVLDLSWAPLGYETYLGGATYSIAVQPDGKLVIAGNAGGPGGQPIVGRLTLGGALDTTFSGDGYWKGAPGSAAGFDTVRLLPSGKILAAGTTQFTMVTARLHPHGTRDVTWGGDGLASYSPKMPVGSSQTTVWNPALAVQPDGRVVFLAGLNAHDLSPGSGFEVPAMVGRLRTNGTPDPTFPQRIIRGVEHRDSQLALQRNGKIVIVLQLANDNVSLRRLHGNGANDASFHTWNSAATSAYAAGVQVQPSGRIVTAGYEVTADIATGILRAFRGDPLVKCDGAWVTHFGTAAADTILGTTGADVVLGYGGGDTIRPGGGADRVCAGLGKDIVYGGAGPDRIFGGDGADRLYGQAGNDRLIGGAGIDLLRGGTGTDVERQ